MSYLNEPSAADGRRCCGVKREKVACSCGVSGASANTRGISGDVASTLSAEPTADATEADVVGAAGSSRVRGVVATVELLLATFLLL